MKLKNKRNHKIRNYGFGSRCPIIAVRNAVNDNCSSYSTANNLQQRFRVFLDFAKNAGNEVKDLRSIDPILVSDFGKEVYLRFATQTISLNTAHNYISAVNKVMKVTRGDDELVISAVSDAGLPRRSYVSKTSKASSETTYDLLRKPQTKENTLRLLQRSFGLRFEESAKSNPTALLKEARRSNLITIHSGTKGGQPRTIPIVSEEQIESLEQAARIQGLNRSLIGDDQMYSTFAKSIYNTKDNEKFHGHRHAYAQERYRVLMNADCPLVAKVNHGKKHYQYLSEKLGISVEHAKIRDKKAREIISKELGHTRTNITNTYLG